MRTSHRKIAARPLRRNVLAAALALAFGCGAANAATDIVVSSTSPDTLASAITTMNAQSNCSGDTITITGDTSPFIVTESSPLPQITCPGLTIQSGGMYGGGIAGWSYGAGWCGLNSTVAINVVNLQISGFSYGGTGAGLCGTYGSVTGNTIHDNFVGVQANVSSLSGNGIYSNDTGVVGDLGDVSNNDIYGNTNEGIRGHVASANGNHIHANNNGIMVQPGATSASSVIGNTPTIPNYIHGNANSGIYVDAGASATISYNRIGMAPDSVGSDGNGTGIYLGGDASTVQGNYIVGNLNEGVVVEDSGGSQINGNSIGLGPAGEVLGNALGVMVYSGTITISGNTISGNDDGIAMYAGGAVTSNLIGLDANGNVVSNTYSGVHAYGSGPTITGNTISGVTYPVIIDNSGGGVLKDNRIGVSPSGMPLPPGEYSQYTGITLNCSSGVTIGSGNIIGGMSNAGIGLFGSSSITITGNRIGVGSDGATAVANGIGVQIGNNGCGLAYGGMLASGKRATGPVTAARVAVTANSNAIQNNAIEFNTGAGIRIDSGSTSSGNQVTGNTITGNGSSGAGSGVSIQDSASLGNSILDNSIYSNTPKNIDINPVDPSLALANDASDTDTGPNDGLNYPEITAVRQNGTTTAIDFNMNVPAGSGTYHVQFFANSTTIPGGQFFVGNADVSAGGATNPSTATFTGTYDNISATATVTSPVTGTTAGDTSEFSPVIATTHLPALVVSPSGFNFGNIEAGTTSATNVTFTLQSVGTAPWTLATFTTTGTCPAAVTAEAFICSGTSFFCSTDCANGQTTAPNSAACTVTAGFQPQTLGPSNLTLTICDNTAGTPQTIQLSGNGTLPPPVSVTPTGFNFGNVVIGTSSPAQTFLVSNPARTPVTLTAPTAASPFAVTATTCGATLGPLSTCTADVTFTPASVGPAPGQVGLSFTSTATGSSVSAPAAAAIAGVGVASVQLTLPPSVAVGTYVIGLTPPTASATVKNTGTTAATINSITASAPFTASSDCGASLAASASCTITIALASTTVGPVTGNVSVTTPAGTQLIALTGTVAPPAVKFTPVQVDFGPVLVNKSATRDIVASNTTTLNVALGAPAISGPFTIASSTCGPLLGANGICTITVGFAPQRSGPASGALALNFGVNASMAPAAAPAKRGAKAATSAATAVASLSGSGIDAAALDMPSLIEFGTYIVGSDPIVRTATISSSGNGVVTFQDISASGPFGLTSDCPINLAPGESCTLTITYSSSALGPAAGLVSIRSNAIGGLRTISLGALTQLKPTPIIDVKPSTISFGNRLIGSQSPTVTVTIGNSGGAAAILGPLTVSDDYVIVSTTCGTTLAMQSACSADIAMRPIGFGPRPGSFSFTSNADGSPHIVGLGGTGCRPPGEASNRGTASDSCAP